MGIYFRKRRSLFGNLLNVNFSRSGLGLSVGVRGFRLGVSSSGRRYVSAGLPGSGIYFRHFAKRGRNAKKPEPAKPEINSGRTPAIADASLLHPAHQQIHNTAYNAGFLFGWLLILSPLVAVAWLLTRLLAR
ncbi:MAG: hypothetical protein DMG97_09780 [Acidobacteria bacterium]|nr:MAG: hypothetical protein DMG97_09780 [Acidobacteriota bacterium]